MINRRHAALEELINAPSREADVFAELEKHLTQTIVGIGARGHVSFGTAHREGRSAARARLGKSFAGRSVDHLLHDLSFG